MPTVSSFNGFRVVIYPNDHSPEHVHVIGAGCEAVFLLRCPNGPPTLRESFGFKVRSLRRIAAQLRVELHVLCRAWEDIHGRD